MEEHVVFRRQPDRQSVAYEMNVVTTLGQFPA